MRLQARSRRRGSVVAVAVLPVLALSGCVPSNPDHDNFLYFAEKAVSNVGSQVGSDAAVLRQVPRHRFLGRYDVVMVTYAESGGGKSADSVLTRQPPERDKKLYDTVSTALDDANSLLTDVRIAVTDRQSGQYQKLLGQLMKTDKQLQKLDTRLRGLQKAAQR
jgi:hypothetical protein